MLVLVTVAAGCGREEVPTGAATAPACDERPPLGHGLDPPSTLECLQVPRRLVPGDAEAAAWMLGGRRFAVVWRTYGGGSGFAIWRRARDGSWDRLLERRRPTALDYAISVDDVTGDGRADVLSNESRGSGGCGPRIVFGVGAERVRRLFGRSTCELDSELQDGLLWFREPIGDCPVRGRAAHCYGGVRITVRGWSGDRIVVDREIVRCLRARLDPGRDCRRRR